jgi:hypothetical protein
MMKRLLCLLFLATTTLAYADMRKSEQAIYLSAPNTPWEIRFPKHGWQLQQERRRQDGLAFYYMFSNPKTKFNVSFYIEPAEKCKTSKGCRSMFWSNPGPLYENPQSVEQFEENGFAIVKFIIPSIQGVQVNQLNYSAHLVRDGYWVDMHLSKLPSQKGDEAILSDFVKAISIMPVATEKTEKTNDRRYPLPDHGFFQMKVPTSWKDELRQPRDRLPPTIVLQPASGDRFQVLITPIWLAGKDVPLPSGEAIRQQVQRAAESAKSQAVEETLKVMELQGSSGRGYYFSATDKAPKPGEYKFMTQGIMRVGELIATFTIHTNDSQKEVVNDALTMLKSAIHLKDKGT